MRRDTHRRRVGEARRLVDLALDVVAALRLEEDHGVVARDRLAHHHVRVGGVRARDDAQAGGVREVRLGRLGVVLGRADAAAEGHADRDGHAHVAARAVVQLRHLGDDLVEAGVDEAVELDLDDRAVPAVREPDGGADDPRLGQRRVDDALGAELGLQPVGDAEHAAEGADVLAHEHDLLVVGEGAPKTGVEGFREGQGRHRVVPSVRSDAPAPGSSNIAR